MMPHSKKITMHLKSYGINAKNVAMCCHWWNKMSTHYGSVPIDYKTYKKGVKQYEQEKLKQMEHDLKKIFVNAYAPKSTRWHRNHTDAAEWFFLWKDKI